MYVCTQEEGHVEKCEKTTKHGNKMAIKEVKINVNDSLIYCSVWRNNGRKRKAQERQSQRRGKTES